LSYVARERTTTAHYCPTKVFLKSASEGQAKQKWLRARNLQVVNEQAEAIFNATSPSAAILKTASNSQVFPEFRIASPHGFAWRLVS